MKADLYKTISLGMIAVLNLFFAASLHAGPLSVGDDTSSQPPIEEIQNLDIEESPDFIMDQTGNSSHDDSHFSDEWESQGNRSLSAATTAVSVTPAAEKKTSKPESLKPEEAPKHEVERAEEEDSSLDTDVTQPRP